ncbi:PREDICTED: uncharacterized protein LOC104827471 [Tarenaya hassleriana]|uniref:uncharacterized protein LOC104827471 n=1 Tax=Tarenaya hassleriana TaxID=28532 RepID=UPI00053C3D96|nr:PREDICTED: uncharacterized protein LOC104827471 [Tarenaya hassleriana]
MSPVGEEVRARAQVYRGNTLCQEKTRLLLKEMAVPKGLMPLKDIEEFGHEKEKGLMWLKQKQSITHKFKKIGKLVSYGTEITAVAENSKLKNITGCKGKEFFLWMSVTEMAVDYPTKGTITFKTPSGLTRTFPSSVFEDEEDDDDEKEKV